MDAATGGIVAAVAGSSAAGKVAAPSLQMWRDADPGRLIMDDVQSAWPESCPASGLQSRVLAKADAGAPSCQGAKALLPPCVVDQAW
jgi:hypothetical protein